MSDFDPAAFASDKDDDAFDPAAFAAGEAAPAAPDERGFFRRAADTISGGVHAVGHVMNQGAKELVGSAARAMHFPDAPAETPEFTRYARGRELARGLDDVTSLGYGQRAADAARRGLGLDTADQQATSAAESTEAAPEYRAAGQMAATFLPNPGGLAARGVSKVAAPLARVIAPGTAKLLAKVAASRGGSVLAPVAASGLGAAKGLASYEAVAPLMSAASANAEGDRLGAAEAAATDPAGLLMSGAAGAAPLATEATGRAVKKYVEAAPAKAAEWLIKDLRGSAKGETTPTARKYLAADEADVVKTLDRHPELKSTLLDARSSSKKALEKASEAVGSKIAEINSPRTALYDKDIDGALGGGVLSGDFVEKIRRQAEEYKAGGTAGGHKMAKYLEARADEIEQSRDWGAKTSRELDQKAANDVKTLQAVRANVKDPTTAKDIDGQIAAIEKTGKQVVQFDPETRVPARTVRAFVTDLQDAAYDGLGGLADTRAAGQSRQIAGDAKAIFDGYLDEAAKTSPEAVAQIRDINEQHSALKNIQRVIDQRLGKATENATGAAGHIPHSLAGLAKHVGGTTGAGIAFATGHPVVGGAMLAAQGIPAAKRAIDVGAAKVASSPGYKAAVTRLARAAKATARVADFVRDAVSAGIPAKDARDMWEAAHPKEARP